MGAETAEIKANKKTDSSSLKNDIERIGKSENGISDEEFFEQHEKQLKTDIKALAEVLSSLDDTRLDQIRNRIIDIGMDYLKKDNTNIFALQIIDALHKPILKLTTEKDIIINMATGEQTEIKPHPGQTESLKGLFDAAANKIKEPVKSPVELDDSSFLDVSEKLNSNLDLSAESALSILLSSKEKPFENIAMFKKIAKAVIENYPIHQNNDLVRLVLRRGAKMLKEDEQTKKEIYRSLENSEYGKIQKNIKDTLIGSDKLMKDGKYKESLEKIIRVLKLDMTNPEGNALFSICTETIVNKGFLLMRGGKYDEAMESFCLILKYLPDDARTISFAAKCQYKKQNSLKNEGPPRPGEKAQQLTEAESDDLINKGAELLSTNKFREARIVFSNLNEFDPGNPMVIHALSVCSEGLANQEITEASETLENIIKSDEWKEPAEIHSLGKTITILVETEKGRLKMEKEIIRKVLPHLTNQLTYAKEAISYKRQLLRSDIGKELTSEEKIRIYGWESFMQANSKMDEYVKNYIKVDPAKLEGEEEHVALSDFTRETADILSDIYPPRFSSLWDFYKVHFNEDRRSILENKDGLPVRRNKNERYISGKEERNPIDDFEYVMNATKNEKLRKAAGTVIEMLNFIKANKEDHTADMNKILFEFKKEVAKAMLEGDGSEEFNEAAESCLFFCYNKDILTKLTKDAPDEEAAKKAKGNLPESETGKDYIDPETELIAYSAALDRYLDAIRLNPKEKKNYIALFKFLGKMDLAKSREKLLRKEVTPGIGEIPPNIAIDWDKFNDDYEKLYKKLAEGLEKTIKTAIQQEISPVIKDAGYAPTVKETACWHARTGPRSGFISETAYPMSALPGTRI